MLSKTLALLTCLALLLAGCGGNDDKSSGGGGGATTTPASGGASAGGDVVTVSMKDVLFKPDKVTVKVGQTVKWTNDDPLDHTVTAKSGADFDSGNVKAGGTFEWKADKAGTVDYVCTIHPSQTGTITVTP